MFKKIETEFKEFETERFELINADRVRITDHHFGHNRVGERDVWIESSDKGERFLSQFVVPEQSFPVRKEIYTKKCYILREKATGRYFFLDSNECGLWLHSDAFFGAESFCGEGVAKIQKWLADSAN